jgi:hypothetical protein
MVLECYNNELSNLNLDSNSNLASLNCSNNVLNSLDVSNNLALEIFECASNNLSCIQVNDTQLANIPANWKKDTTASYATNCN